jgi:hypothetical protein
MSVASLVPARLALRLHTVQAAASTPELRVPLPRPPFQRGSGLAVLTTEDPEHTEDNKEAH